jgi:hypothetical protein
MIDPAADAPVIGLSMYGVAARWGPWEADAVLLPSAYVNAVVAAGGIPVLLPPMPGAIHAAMPRLDGLLLAGGPDIDPARYGALVETLAPAAAVLLAPLRERARDDSLSETERTIAGNILINYAAGRVDVLTDVLLEGGSPARQAAVIGKLASLSDRAIPLLEPVLLQKPQDLRASWKDEPLADHDPPASAALQVIEQASGMVGLRFAKW